MERGRGWRNCFRWEKLVQDHTLDCVCVCVYFCTEVLLCVDGRWKPFDQWDKVYFVYSAQRACLWGWFGGGHELAITKPITHALQKLMHMSSIWAWGSITVWWHLGQTYMMSILSACVKQNSTKSQRSVCAQWSSDTFQLVTGTGRFNCHLVM